MQCGVEGSLEQQNEGGSRSYELSVLSLRRKPETSPSKSTSYSCAMDNMSSPSLASTVLIRSLFESLKWTLMLDSQCDSEKPAREWARSFNYSIRRNQRSKVEHFKPRSDETGREDRRKREVE